MIMELTEVAVLQIYNIEDAEQITGHDCRQMHPEERYDFMSCQIGDLKRGRFHLKAFGRSWTEALVMWGNVI